MSKIEKQFFDTFGIEKKPVYSGSRLYNPFLIGYEYPQITDRILLELICILNDFEGIDVKATTVNELKEELLKQAIEPVEYPIAFEEYHEIEKLYHQVQALFKENN